MTRLILYWIVCWSTLAALAPRDLPGGPLWVIALGVVTGAPIVRFLARRSWRRYPGAGFRLLVIRPILYVQLLLPLVTAGALLGLLGGAVAGAPLAGARVVAGGVLAVMLLLFAAGYIGSRRLVVREVEAIIPDLPPEFDGLRIAQISDLHVGPHTSRRFLARVARTVMGQSPDIIAVTGDLVDDRAEDVEHYAAGLGGLRAPLGVYLIPGNHDVYAGWHAVERQLTLTLGATVLVNDARMVTRGSSRLAIVGTGDPAGRRSGDAAPDIDRTLRGVPPGAPVIALAHNPALWPALAERGVSLTLSGHTHWGQFAFPGIGWSLASPFQKRAMGAHQVGSSLLYIHPGTGYWGLPFRIGARPEVALVTLRAGEQAAIRMAPSETVPCRVRPAESGARRRLSGQRRRRAPA